MPLRGLRVRIKALGCRTNIAEAEALASAFLRAGAQVVDHGPWDIAVAVTCSITAMADRKSRQELHRLRRDGPEGLLIACGCWAQGVDAQLARAMGVDVLVGNRRKGEILELAAAAWQRRGDFLLSRGPLSSWDGLELDRPVHHSRAFIKVQDGCDHRCSYCIVPLLRGPSVSRPLEDVEAESRRALASGCSELVLTGVHLGLYGRDWGRRDGLASLVRRIGTLPGLSRLRFGSLEPFSIGDDLVEAMAETTTFCRHLHLPLQSGDDSLLRRMGRGHSAEDYLALTERLRRALGPDLHLSTDVMVAFPGESAQAFENTLELLHRARIGRVHGFRYSPRQGTAAAAMDGQISDDEAASRMARLKDQAKGLLDAEARRWLGRDVEVFFEGQSRGRCQGYSNEYLEFRLLRGQRFRSIAPCRVEAVEDGVLLGFLVP